MAPARTDEKPDAPALRRFGLTVGGVLAGLFGLALPLLRHRAVPHWPFYPAGLLVGAALVAPAALAPVQRAWTGIGRVLGWVNSRIILIIVFAVVVTPLAL